MKQDLMEMIDDKYILEAEPNGQIKSGKRKFRISAAAAAIAACTGLMALTAAAVVHYNSRPSTEEYYNSKTDRIIESQGLKINEKSYNSHFEVTLESVLADDYSFKIFLTARPLDAKGKEYVEQATSTMFPDLHLKTLKENGDEVRLGTGMRARAVDDSLAILVTGVRSKELKDALPDNKMYMAIYSEESNLLESIVFCADINPNLETRCVTSKDGIKIYASPIGFALIGKDQQTTEKAVKSTFFTWKEGGRERFLDSIGITAEQDKKYSSKNRGVEWNYLILGEYYSKDMNYGVGGGGVCFYTEGYAGDPTPEELEKGIRRGYGEYVMTVDFGCVVDINDTTGIVYGNETIPY